jgi:hypothetical protein
MASTSTTIEATISAVPVQFSNIIDTIAVSSARAAKMRERLKGHGFEMGSITGASVGIQAWARGAE